MRCKDQHVYCNCSNDVGVVLVNVVRDVEVVHEHEHYAEVRASLLLERNDHDIQTQEDEHGFDKQQVHS